jgi:hypothetical protein
LPLCSSCGVCSSTYFLHPVYTAEYYYKTGTYQTCSAC